MSRQGALLSCVLLLAAAAFAGEERAAEVRLLFTGDILLSRQVQAELEYRRTSPWAAFQSLFQQADWVGGNFEGAIGAAADCLPAANPCFATAQSAVRLLREAGFTAVTIENNHAGDLGSAGRERTLGAFGETDILPLDFDSSPQFLRLGSATVAVIALTTTGAADGRVQQIPSVELMQKLRLARQLANLVVISIHWGSELIDWPNPSQRRQAEWLVAHGADLILGHHPHVVQAPECIGGRPVFFSLGNHVFDQKYPETKQGLIADCRISTNRLQCAGIRTQTGAGTSVPAIAKQDEAFASLTACTPRLAADVVINRTTLKPEHWLSGQPTQGLALEGWSGGKMQWRSRRQKIVSLQIASLAGDKSEPLVLSLEQHASSIDREIGIRPYVYSVGAHGPIARWRGSALAWPLLDALVDRDHTICALHRGDSFVALDRSNPAVRYARYRWNGFGFSGVDEEPPASCAELFR